MLMLDILVWMVIKESSVLFSQAFSFNDNTTKLFFFPACKMVGEKGCSRVKYFSASLAKDTLWIATATLKWLVTVKFRVILL